MALVRMEPILRWPGGKRKLLPEIRARMPGSWRRYLEPFLGGGALFFGLEARPAVVGDVNPWLIDAYLSLAHELDAVVARLREHQDVYRGPDREGYYYAVRDKFNDGQWATDRPARAAAFIFLNKTCYNGLCRSNKQGKFNVPEGDLKNPTILDEVNLRRAAELLREADVMLGGYDVTTMSAAEGDFIYCDPPYDPVSETANFTAYSAGGFGPTQQAELAAYARQLADRGALVMLSNSDTPRVRALYDGWNIDVVKCGRSINSRGDKRGSVDELLIRSYS